MPSLRVLALSAVVLAATAPSAPAAVTVGLTGPDGNPSRIGPIGGDYLLLGQSSERDVRRAEGRKPHSNMEVMGLRGVAGRTLTYRFKETRRRTCVHEYGFPTGHRLGDFSSTCRATRTPRGGRVGMTARQAQTAEGGLFVLSPSLGHDCSFADVGLAEMGSAGMWIVLWSTSRNPGGIDSARVRSIDAYAADAVIWSVCM